VEGRPPTVWERLLRWSTPERHRDAAVGDAAEEWARRRKREGEAGARRWYRRQALASFPHGLRHRAGELGRRIRTPGEEEGGMGRWWGDLRIAGRNLMKRPFFTAAVVATLGVGVGATSALFGVFQAVFLEPLPLPESHELVTVMEAGGFGCCGPASGPDYTDWRQEARSFEALAALSPGSFNLTGLDEPRRVLGLRATSSAFAVAGVEPYLGRTLQEEDAGADGSGVVVLSHGFWERVFVADPGSLGQSLEIDGEPRTVVGVMPPGFDVPSPWARTTRHEFYLPLSPVALADAHRGNHSYPVVGRLGPGVELEQAQAEMDGLAARAAEAYPESHAVRSVRVFTIHDYLYSDIGEQLLLILGAAAVVLLVACGNVAGLQLARAVGRESELALRAAIGASRGAIVRLLFSESLLLALLGGVLGMALSFAMVDVFRSLLPASVPRVADIAVDGTVLFVALGSAGLTALLFGMVPAVLAARGELAAAVKERGYSTLAPAKERVRDGFIVLQVALGLVLVNGAGLLVQSYTQLRGEDMGIRAEGVVTFALDPRGDDYEDGEARRRFFEEVTAEVSAVPGVTAAGMVTKLPLAGGTNGTAWVEGQPRPNDGGGVLVEVSSISGDYLQAMDIPLMVGRTFLPADADSGAATVLVNQAFVRQAWPDEDPLGKRFAFGTEEVEWLTVVGVVGDVRQWSLERAPLAEAYFPYPRGWATGGHVAARVEGDPTTAAPAVRRAVLAVDPGQPPSDFQTMSALVESRFAQRRFYTTLIGLFAGVALVLAAGGIYGTVSYFVARRTRELGIRMALGAPRTGLMRLVVRRGLRLAFWGVGLGLLGVWASSTVLESLVYSVEALDWKTLVAGCIVLGGATLAASALPARRAMRVSPIVALRHE